MQLTLGQYILHDINTYRDTYWIEHYEECISVIEITHNVMIQTKAEQNQQAIWFGEKVMVKFLFLYRPDPALLIQELNFINFSTQSYCLGSSSASC